MVWLHGGGWTAGSGQEQPAYNGENLSRRGNVVVVGLNHRLNMLGYLNLAAYGDKYANSVSAGVLDLVLNLPKGKLKRVALVLALAIELVEFQQGLHPEKHLASA